MKERREFGAALRGERERKGITLDAVAERTKINVALLAGLERGDLCRWPAGIFRRAFVRAYAEAIGADPDEVLAEFERVFPEQGEDGIVRVPAFGRAGTGADSLRLTLASRPRLSGRVWGLRMLAALADTTAVASLGAAMATVSHQPFVLTALVVGLTYFGLGTLCVESSPATWLVRRLARARSTNVPAASGELATPLEISGGDSPRPELTARGASLRRDRRGARGDRPRVTRTAHRVQ